MKKPFSIHIFSDPDEYFVKQLKNRFKNKIEISASESIPPNCEASVLIAGVRTEDQITALSNLKYLIIPWAGFPKITAEIMAHFPHISVHNIHHNATVTAEMTFTLLLTAMKRIIPIDRDFRKSDWRRRYHDEPILSLEKKHALIMGNGAIGSKVANFCRAFGMHVSVISRTKSKGSAYTLDDLDVLLPQANALVISIPLTKSTANLFTKDKLALLPDDSTVVNIARGGVVDEEALYNELKSGRLRAGIDVWYNYPMTEEKQICTPPSDFPFHELDNVVMTPHIAGHSDIVEQYRTDALAELLDDLLAGKPMRNKIDLALGY